MTNINLYQWLENPGMLNKDTLYELRIQLNRNPYCQTLRLLLLKNLFLLHDTSFGAELRKSALYITDRSVLFYLLEGESIYQIERSDITEVTIESQSLESTDRTSMLIDAFLALDNAGETLTTDLDYTTDYTSILLQSDDEEEANSDVESPVLKGIELIDGFIERSETQSTPFLVLSANELSNRDDLDVNSEDTESVTYNKEDETDECFTETLAKIYIKQHRYSKALEIIKKLSLKYPKKNAYFADQIRFLEKLIINAKSK